MFKSLAIALSAAAISTGVSEGVVTLTVNSYDSTHIDVTLTGTVTSVNSQDWATIFWGLSGGGNYINDNLGSSTITDMGSPSLTTETLGGFIGNTESYFTARSGPFRQIVMGDTINFNSVSTGSFNWAGVDPNDFVVMAGYEIGGGTVISANSAFTGGGVNVVPEPSALSCSLVAVGLTLLRRSRRSSWKMSSSGEKGIPMPLC